MDKPISEVKLMDCMEGMREFHDGFFDLAIVDPPYGIGRDGQYNTRINGKGRKGFPFKGWDCSAPNIEYFNELFRVSKNQIIWGANFFTENIPPSMGWIFWDKGQRICQSDGELAYSSFKRALRVVEIGRHILHKEGITFHPTQKPIALYEWLLRNYAKTGDKILDTHLGSGSSRIAAYKLGFDFWGFEIDEDYFRDADKRFLESIAMTLFDNSQCVEQLKMF